MDTETLRVGLLVPSSNTVMEPDLYRNLPSSITLHTARMFLEETTPEAERVMLCDHLPRAAAELATVRPHVVVMGCTSAGALVGGEAEAAMCERLATVTGARAVVSVMSAVREVLRARGWRRLLVLTPYIDALNGPVRAGLEGAGLEVVKLHGLGIQDNADIGAVAPEDITRHACREFAGLGADGVFISCTNFRSLEAAASVSQALRLPAIGSNACVVEALLELNPTRPGS